MLRTPQSVIRRPLLTEKGTRLRETGGNAFTPDPEEVEQKLLFEVLRDANKVEIKAAVEKLFNVSVTSVRTQIVRGKERRIGKFAGMRPSWKKAIVTLKPGQSIEFFEGV